MTRWVAVLVLALCSLNARAQPAALSDDELWLSFEKWVAALAPLPPGQRVLYSTRYASDLAATGVSKEEAQLRFERINKLRRASIDRERIYWNGSFKLGGGPSSPLRLLEESLTKVKPGKALDSGMGRGRNAIYLASTGWDVTGYDMAQDALTAAQAAARAAGVTITTVEAKHEDFDFGENRWDLIVCSYNYMRPDDPRWPPVLLRSLRPGGLVVYQTAILADVPWSKILELWSGFRIIRMENVDAGVVDDDWTPSRTFRTMKLVARRE